MIKMNTKVVVISEIVKILGIENGIQEKWTNSQNKRYKIIFKKLGANARQRVNGYVALWKILRRCQTSNYHDNFTESN